MKKYSVWDAATRRYNYYQAPGDVRIHAGAPPRSSTSELGATPEQAAWPLPAGAVKIGSGEMPEGRIASTENGGSPIDLKQAIFYGALGYIAWRMIR